MIKKNSENSGKIWQPLHWIVFLSGSILFWVLRVFYWSITKEIPFSDMAGYDRQGHSLAGGLTFDGFDWTPFYKSMIVPTLPLMRATQIWLFGDSMLAWRIFMGVLAYGGLVWLVREVIMITKKNWLGLGLLFIVALSKSSIFWSLKIAHEGPAELFIYLCLASAFFAIRKGNYYAFFIQGLIWGLAVFNRPNFAFIIPIFIIQFLGHEYLKGQKSKKADRSKEIQRQTKKNFKKAIVQIAFYCSAGLLVYAPWAYRSYNIYGNPFVFSTEGIWGFLWELPLKVEVEPGKIITSAHELENWIAASGKWKHDYDASEFTNQVAIDWLKENWREYPRMVASKVWHSISDRFEYLTIVSRLDLFPGGLNYFLIDKSVFYIVTGILGLLAMSFAYKSFYLILLLSVIPWLSAAMLVGYPRLLDPMVPIILFGNFCWIDIASKKIGRIFKDRKLILLRISATITIIFSIAVIGYVVLENRHYASLPKSGPVLEKTQILQNSDFEDWKDPNSNPENWLFGGDRPGLLKLESGQVKSGKNAVRVLNSANGGSALFQDFEWKAEVRQVTLKFAAWIKSSTPGAAHLALAMGDETWRSIANQKVNEWEYITISRRIFYHAKNIRAHVYVYGNAEVVIDDVTLDANYDAEGAELRGHF